MLCYDLHSYQIPLISSSLEVWEGQEGGGVGGGGVFMHIVDL